MQKLSVFNSHNFHIQVFLVTGGSTDWLGTLDSTEVYDPSVGSWMMTRAKLPAPMQGLRATNIDGRILLFGKDIDSYKYNCWGLNKVVLLLIETPQFCHKKQYESWEPIQGQYETQTTDQLLCHMTYRFDSICRG